MDLLRYRHADLWLEGHRLKRRAVIRTAQRAGFDRAAAKYARPHHQ